MGANTLFIPADEQQRIEPILNGDMPSRSTRLYRRGAVFVFSIRANVAKTYGVSPLYSRRRFACHEVR